MFCNRCGSTNFDDVRFCVSCGAPVSAPKAPPTESPSPEYTLPSFTHNRPPQPPYPQHIYQGYQSGQGGGQGGGQAGGSGQGRGQGSASGRAITAMVLSLVSLVSCGPFLSVPGLILGKQELDAIRRGEAPIAGEGFAKVGYYAGIIITLLSCLGGFIYLIVAFLAFRGAPG